MILVCGEALIDLFVGPAEGSEMPARAVAGGSPFNVAIGLARLGVKAGFLGGISRDHFGALLAGILVHERIDDRFLVRTDRLSTISMVATDDNGQPSYVFHGEGAADRSLTLADLPAKLPPEVQALTFGSYTMAVEPVGSAFAALAERVYRNATIIKASDEDVRAAWGGCVSVAEAAVYWLNCGARLVVVTEGAKGATAFCAAGHVSVPAHSVVVRDTVGAGDTFHAALLAQLAKTDKLDPDAIAALDLSAIRDLLGYAMAAASVTVSRNGADLPTEADVAANLAAVGRLSENSVIDSRKGLA